MTAKKKTSKAAASPRAKRVQFVYEEPGAREVSVTGSFCDWDDKFPLKRGDDGKWKRTMNIPRGRHEYLFVVDGDWREDPNSSERVPNPYGGVNSVLNL